ncbi:hypothetical protein VitviT2T_024428 [Vitis vinifera]|uniref:Myb/SANT-like domain-containing protein n=1 Tax=Vitis vinifera TaxID=29760 RepID=A0ABY9DFY4_VITVI|nr:hypothetical protein VitviT2T_024428 [Vitis vinifera]
MDSGTFSTNTWKRILLEVNSQEKRNFNLKQFKQKFNRLCVMPHEFSDLLKHTGFGRDVETNTVHALEETWKNYIQAHPNAKYSAQRVAQTTTCWDLSLIHQQQPMPSTTLPPKIHQTLMMRMRWMTIWNMVECMWM